MAAVTAALVAPKNTVFCAGVVLKLVPVMVTVVPITPLVGEKLVMVVFGPVPANKRVTPVRCKKVFS